MHTLIHLLNRLLHNSLIRHLLGASVGMVTAMALYSVYQVVSDNLPAASVPTHAAAAVHQPYQNTATFERIGKMVQDKMN